MNLRELFIQWLTASRFIQSLEARYQEQRQDFTERLAEKNAQIFQQRTEISALKLECDRMRTVLMPYGSPAGAEYSRPFETSSKPPAVPVFDGPDDWMTELNRAIKEEYGVQGERREGIHEPATDEGA